MCRLLLAQGDFTASAVFHAAALMAGGGGAKHDGPIRVHPDGWGMAAYDRGRAGWSIHRSTHPIFDTDLSRMPAVGKPELLLVHSRHATRLATKGLEFTHPVEEVHQDRHWHLMHNGYLPTTAFALGRDQSRFDSREYLELLLRCTEGSRLDPETVLASLGSLEPPGSSANAFLFNDEHLYVIHWSFRSHRYPHYVTLWSAGHKGASFISSEILETLAPRASWKQLAQSLLIEIPLKT
ncbi:class II glutamine amidotransferase [Azospirillum canadense]|uniref:class II glutamine amidotransferase n=1 Tax=Azospirillum canadense TaxID=403962 RepID=UPI0022275EA8|nr:class II glutamine amidotransferase [Azospirillum canadense]MCW2239652.1 glutamine amidotransferase [Azospirillum canadense]